MRTLGALPIRTQLLLLAAMVAAPMLGLLTWSGLHVREEAMDRARVQAQRLADALVAEHETVVAGAQQLLLALAHLPAVKARDPGVRELLQEVMKHNPHLLNVLVADRAGQVWAWGAGAGGAAVADRRYFTEALATGRLAAGEYAVSRSTGRPTLHLGLPYLDATGRTSGVIAVALALERYRAVLERSPLPAGSSYLLLDRRGTILARAAEQEQYQGRPFIPERFAAMVAGPDQGTDVGMTMVGDERVVAWRKLRLPGEAEPYLYVRVGLPVAAVLAGADADLARNLALALALLAPSMALVVWAGKRWLVDRLRALEAASARMADGDLSVRVGDRVRGGELGSLAAAFDRMAGQLAARTRALADGERTYREILDGTQDAIFVHEAETGRILDVNLGVERLFGFGRAELLDGTVTPLSTNEPPYTPEEAARRVRLAATEGPQAFEWPCRRKDGETFWGEVRLGAAAINGQLRVLAAVHDVSGRKRAEAEALRLQGQLLQAQKLETVGRLAGGVAHDINNMLSVVLGEAELLKSGYPAGHPVHQSALEIEGAGTRSRDITRQLLSFSRRQVSAPRPVALPGHLADTRSTLARLIGADVQLVLDAPPDTWPVLADPAQLDQVLVNLLANARDAMPAGGTVRLTTRNVRLDEAACRGRTGWRPGEWVRLSVADQGVGMDAETLARVFEPFFSTKPVERATGLGLSTVYGIVTQGGGFVDATSAPGQGASFDVYLPRSAEPAGDPTSPGGAPRPGAGAVLLVEDDPLVRRTALRMLESLGYRVLAATPEEALRACQDPGQRVDVLLTDVVMPGMRGPELRRRVAALRPDLPVVFMSGHTDDCALPADATGRVLFLQKPFSRADLAARLHEALAPA